MSGISKFKRIYSEGVAAEHPDVAGQPEFASNADKEIARRRAARAKKAGPQLPSFVASVKKEETELDEEKRPFPFEKVEAKKEKVKKGSLYARDKGDSSPVSDSEMEATRKFNKMSVVSAAETRKKQKADRNEEFELDEKIDVGADAGATISDFVHSKSKTFKGDSKKQRIKRALGAYYAAQREETENIYNYVIETLVAADYAESYETAENMFEHMSSEFVAVILEEYIEEAKRSRTERRAKNAGKKGYNKEGKPVPKVSKTHVIHDVDDNVADQRHPDAAKIDLHKKDSGSYKHVKAMTPSEFAHTPLEPKHEYGFDEFRDTDKFKKTTKKTKVAGMGDSPRRPAKKSVVTARGGSAFGSNKPSTPMDDPGSFAKDLRDRIGIRGLKRKDVHFTGGMSKGPNKGLSGPKKKGKLVSKIVDPSDRKEITTDDHLGNTRAMAAAASAAAPQAKVVAYQSRPATRKPKGKGKVGDIVPKRVGKENKPGDTNIGIRANSGAPKSTKQTQRARKKARRGMGEEMSSYEYWKQFVD